MSGMYFDAVLDQNAKPLFNGTVEETKEWLREHKDDVEVQNASVCLGRTLTTTSIENYLNNA